MILSQNIHAQKNNPKYQLEWAFDEELESPKGNVYGIVFDPGRLENIYLIKNTGSFFRKRRGYFIEKYSNKLDLITRKPLNLGKKKKGNYFENGLCLDEEMILFTTIYERKTEKQFLNFQEFNTSTLYLESKKHLLLKSRSSDISTTYLINTCYSPDKSLSAVYYTHKFKGKLALSVHVFNRKMERVKTMFYDSGVKTSLSELFGFVLDNDTSFYCLSKEFFSKKKMNSLPDEVKYNVVRIIDSTQTLLSLQVNDFVISNYQLSLSPNDKLILSGLYSNSDYNNTVGTYYIEIDPNSLKSNHEIFQPFSREYIISNFDGRDKRKAETKIKKGESVELSNFNIYDQYFLSDNSSFLIGEHKFEELVIIRGDKPSETRRERHFYFNQIMVIHLDPKGNIIWSKNVDKAQHLINKSERYGSFYSQIVKDHLYILFNDDPANLKHSESEKLDVFAKFDKSCCVLVEMDSTGQIQKNELYSDNLKMRYLVPTFCNPAEDDKIVLFMGRHNSSNLGILTIP